MIILILKKLCKHILYYICVFILLLAYWGVVKVYSSNFPIFNYSFLDWISSFGLYAFMWMKMDSFRNEVLKYLDI